MFTCKKNELFPFFIVPLIFALGCHAQSEIRSKPNPVPQKIRFSASNSWSRPYAFYDQNKNLVGGIIKDLMDEIADQLGKTPEYVTIPRKLVDTASASLKIDARCYVIESWVQDPNIYDWSKDLFDIVNVVAFSKEVPPIRKIEDLKGVMLGTVLGYKYPMLDALFENSIIQRSDAGTEESNIQKLVQNHLQYAIVETAEFSWHLKDKDRERFLAKDFFELVRHPVKCAVVKKSSASVKDFDRVIGKLKREGFFDKIFAKYGIDRNSIQLTSFIQGKN
jgi:polar amino acid transport system substrate-binding protein